MSSTSKPLARSCAGYGGAVETLNTLAAAGKALIVGLDVADAIAARLRPVAPVPVAPRKPIPVIVRGGPIQWGPPTGDTLPWRVVLTPE